MAQQFLILGSANNDHTGEGLRDGGLKIQADFTELYKNSGLNQVWFSTLSGVTDLTGATNYRNILNTAVQSTAAAGQVLVIDMPVLVNIGLDATQPIFVPANTKIVWTPSGVIITDNMLLPLFDLINAPDVTFVNYTVQYIGTPGVTCIDYQNPADSSAGVSTLYNDTYVKAYMGSAFGNTFSGGGSSLAPANTDRCGQIIVRGSSHRFQMLGRNRFFVPQGAPACNFIPVCIAFEPQWKTGILVTSTIQSSVSSPAPSTVTFPDHVYIQDLEIDGAYMGLVGTPLHIQIDASRGLRYSDMQDANGNNQGGKVYAPLTLGTTPVATNTTVNIGGSWAYSNKSTTITFNTGFETTIAFANGSSTGTLGAALPAGTYTTACGIKWSNNWFAPPHMFYMHAWDFTGNFPCEQNIKFYDEGIYVGSPNRRNTGSGYLNTIKAEVANGSLIEGTTFRPDGGIDLLTFGGSNGYIKMICQFDSTTARNGQLVFTGALSAATSANLNSPWFYGSGSQTYTITFSDASTQTGTFVNGQTLVTWPVAVTATAIASVANTSQQPMYAARFPSTPPMIGLTLDIDYIDVASAPAGASIQGDGQPGNTGVNIRARGVLNDVPYGATWNPGFKFGGNNIKIDHTLILKSMSTTQTFIGMFPNQNTYLSEAEINITVIGWRSAAVAFTANLVNATTATLTNWNYGNGTFTFAFSNAETRQVTVSGTGCTWTQLINTGDAVAAVQLLNDTNIDSYVSRAQVMFGGFSYGTSVTVNDVTNGIVQTIENGLHRQKWRRLWSGYPTGASYSTPIAFPTTFAVTSFGYVPNVSLTGPTAMNIGWPTAQSALVSAGGVTSSSNPWTNPSTFPIAVPSTSPIVITPNASITAGHMYFTVTAERWSEAG